MKTNFKIRIYFLLLVSLTFGCKKILVIPPPTGVITSSQVFATDQQAMSAAAGMYFTLINTDKGFASSGTTLFAGMSADEIVPFNQTGNNLLSQFQRNSLNSTNVYIGNSFWTNAFSVIYSANAIIDGLNNSSGVHQPVKNELLGEAKFVRAFCNFYLVNLFGDIPLPETINWHKTNLLSRTSSSLVYSQIIADLKDAVDLLSPDDATGTIKRIVPNKWAAEALLSRVYLYQGDWVNAASTASTVINKTDLFSLNPNLDNTFLLVSQETIWQLQQSNTAGTSFNVTPDGYLFIPRELNAGFQPLVYLSGQLLSNFEHGDQRKIHWVDSTSYNGTTYYFPFKYKGGPADAAPSGAYSELYVVLRLAELYLIRAEAEAHGAGLNEAVKDLNIIRNRAGLSDYAGPLVQDAILKAIAKERQVELFAEWGHRWLDLKRTGQAIAVLSADKGFALSKNSLLYPIPVSELQTDPNLTQNPGY